MADNDGAGWAPKDQAEYIESLHQAQLKTEQHKWEQALGLKADKDEKDAKAAAENGGTDGKDGKDDKPKRRSFL